MKIQHILILSFFEFDLGPQLALWLSSIIVRLDQDQYDELGKV